MRTLHLFAGAGGGIIADMMLGHTPVAAVEIDPFCREVLKARQRDGWLPEFEIFEDVREFDGTKWRGKVDCICGGFPCQDISCAGKGAGIHGERSGLFFEMARIVNEVRPRYVFMENSPNLVCRGLDAVLWTMAQVGYDSRWCVLSAAAVGAMHRRDRWWGLFANADRQHGEELRERVADGKKLSGPDELCGEVPDTENKRLLWRNRELRADFRIDDTGRGKTFNGFGGGWLLESRLGGVANGLAARLDGPGEASPVFWTSDEWEIPRIVPECNNRRKRLKAIGNGQVPVCAAAAFLILMEMFEKGGCA